MSVRRLKLFSFGLLLLSITGAVSLSRTTSTAQETVQLVDPSRNAVLEEMRGYRQWTRVNAIPLAVFGSEIVI